MFPPRNSFISLWKEKKRKPDQRPPMCVACLLWILTFKHISLWCETTWFNPPTAQMSCRCWGLLKGELSQKLTWYPEPYTEPTGTRGFTLRNKRTDWSHTGILCARILEPGANFISTSGEVPCEPQWCHSPLQKTVSSKLLHQDPHWGFYLKPTQGFQLEPDHVSRV